MNDRYEVHADTEDGYTIGYSVWDTQEQRCVERRWAGAGINPGGWTREQAEAYAANLNTQ
ncbi:MAG: hypothetical protein AB7R89_13870 [Dehalococcoidia bacterium]